MVWMGFVCLAICDVYLTVGSSVLVLVCWF